MAGAEGGVSVKAKNPILRRIDGRNLGGLFAGQHIVGRTGGSKNNWAKSPSASVVLVLALVTTIGFSASSDGSSHAARSTAPSIRGATSELSMLMPTPSSYIPNAPVLVPEGWTATASSQTPGHPADAILESEPTVYWQSTPRAALPQSITIDMHAAQEVSALTYEPRHGAEPEGAIGRFEVTVSTDGTHFGAPIATGTWQNTTGEKTIGFAPVTVRWVRLTALDYAAGSGSAVTASSVTLYGAPQEEATLDSSTAADISTNPAIVGQWGATIGFPLVPVAAALLPDNQLLTWSADSDESFAPEGTAN